MPGITDAINPAAAGAGILLGGAEFAMGAIEERKAKNELKRLHAPFYKIQDEYLQNRNIAEELAGSGLPDATKAFLTAESERGLGTGIKGILDAGGSPNDISKLFGVFDTSVMRTASADAEARLGNIKNFMDINREIAGQKQIQFGINELQPYESALKSIQDRREAARQNMFGGASTAIGSVSALGTSLQNNALLKSLRTTNAVGGNGSPQESFYNGLFSGVGTASSNAAKGANSAAAGVLQALMAAKNNGADVTDLANSIDWSAINKF